MAKEIRVASLQDAELITKVHSSSWRSAYQEILPQEYLDKEVENEKREFWVKELAASGSQANFVLLATEAGKPVGFISVYDVADGSYDAFIDNLHVMPDEKRKGIGFKLMIAAASKLKSLKKRSVYLWVFDDNLPAFGFYKKLGGIMADKSICTIKSKEISQTRFYWDDFTVLALPD